MQKNRFALGLTLALTIAGAAWAQQPMTVTPVTGRVASIDAVGKTFTVTTPTGVVSFATNGQTMFMHKDAHVNLSDLKVGDQIRVTFTGSDPSRIAAHVDTLDPGAANQPMAAMPGMSGMPDMAGMMDAKSVTGRVTSLDTVGRGVTIDTPSGSQTFPLAADARITARDGSSDLSAIQTGDQVRLELDGDSRKADRVVFLSRDATGGVAVTSNQRRLPKTASSLPLYGLTGLAMVAAALALRAHRLRAI